MLQLMKRTDLNPKPSMNLSPTALTIYDSLLFLKRLADTAISTILYLRKVFPDEEFEEKVFGGIMVRLVKQESADENILKVKKWIAGAFDALEKGYLQSMTLDIMDGKSSVTLEMYTFTFGYGSKNPSLEVSVRFGSEQDVYFRSSSGILSEIQTQTVQLLQMCYTVTKSSSDLPSEIFISMKLSYTENTPRGYRPFGYKDYVPSDPVFVNKLKTIEIGDVDTRYHFVRLVSQTCLVDESMLPKFDDREKTENKKNLISSKFTVKEPMVNCYPSGVEDNMSQKSDASQISRVAKNSQSTDDGLQSDQVRCPCLSQRKNSVMYQCSGCSYWVHAECFGILLSNNVLRLETFYCQICHKLNRGHHCHDTAMTSLTRASDQQKLAVQRRLLSFCRRIEGQEVSFRKFERVSGLECQQVFVQKILKEMVRGGILREGSGNMYTVVKEKVCEKIPVLFYVEPQKGCKFSSDKSTENGKKLKKPKTKRRIEVTHESRKKVFMSLRDLPGRTAKWI